MSFHLPVMRPLLPTRRALSPYLRRIDDNRWYSNTGPLTQELATRLGHHHGAQALPLANATIGLTAALLAHDLPAKGLCLMPSWSFAATAQAARMAGLSPRFCDVEPEHGLLTPHLAEQAMAATDDVIAAVMPVCPFGYPVDWAGWQDFHRRHRIAVIIDAAAAFDTVQALEIPAVVSLHATKVLGAGEGGYALCQDTDLLRRMMRIINFGMDENRYSVTFGGNGKLSEYHAAVALAGLDQWPVRRRRLTALLGRLRRAVGEYAHWPQGLGHDYVTSTACVRVDDALATEQGLRGQGIESRRWWSGPLHRHPAFADGQDLPVTERLAATTLGLPCWIGMSAEAITALSQSLARISLNRRHLPAAGPKR